MLSDKVEVGAIPTSRGWVIVSLPKELVRLAATYLPQMGNIAINGVQFELKQMEKDE